MSTTIESLELEIQSNSTSATSGITALQQSLEKLKAATKGGLGLTSIANQITKVGNAVNSINASTLGNLTGLASAIQSLAGVKISSTLGKNLSSMATAIDSLDIDKFTSKVKEMTTALEPLSTQMKNISAGFKSFNTNSKKVTQANNTMATSNKKSGMSFIQFGSKVVAVAYSIGRVVDLLGGLIKKSSSYIENLNLFTVSMGSYASEAKAYAEQVSEIMGIDPGEWMHHQGIFQTLATGFGVAGDKAAVMSKNLTQLGYDISSFHNLDIGESMEKLQSGLAGELEPLRRIGYDLSQAKLAATALELGIDKSVSSMTQAEKAMLRYYAIMTQVTIVQGDMARTLDAPANQMRIAKAQLEMLARSFGNIFIPILNKVLPYVIAVTKVLREMVDAIASFAGFELPEVDDSGVAAVAGVGEDTAEALGGATEEAKKLKSYMLGFDELNVISPNNESSSAEEGVGSGFDFELPEYDFIGEATNKRVEGIITKIKELLEPFKELVEITEKWVETLDIEPMGEGLESMAQSLVDEWTILGDILSWVYTEGFLPIGKWLIESGLPTFLEALAKATDMTNAALKPLVDGIKELKPILEPVFTWVGEVVIILLEGLADIFGKLEQVFTEKGGKITGIIQGFGEYLMVFWNFLKPLIDGITQLLSTALSLIGDLLAGVLGGVIDIVAGFIDTVVGVLTGDWERARKGIAGIFTGLWGVIKSAAIFAWESTIEVTLTAFNAIVGIFKPIGIWFYNNVILPVGDFFKGLWESVSGFFSNLWEDIVKVWQDVSNWFDEKVIQPVINFFAPIVETISQFFYGCWLIIQAAWLNVSTWFDFYVIQPVVEFFKALWTDISGFFSELWEDIKGVWKDVSNWFDEQVIQPVVGFFKNVWVEVSGFFSNLWEDIKGVWNAVTNWFDDNIIKPVSTAFEKVCDKIGEFFTNLWFSIKVGAVQAMNGMIGSIESAINWLVDGINGLVGGFNSVVSWAADVLGKDWGGITLVQKVTLGRIPLPTYANGGFPESGQAFIARENGIPEMVGSIGRRTAVANNTQIVESVASGVAEANSEQNVLLREQNELLRALLEKESGVYLDGRSLSESVDKYKREKGRVLVTGGAL